MDFMLSTYRKDIRIIQNDDMRNSFEIIFNDFGVIYHLGYHSETDFEFFFSRKEEYKLFRNLCISFTPEKVISLLGKIKPVLSKDLNIVEDFNIYGEKKLTMKDKAILKYVFIIVFVEQVNYLIENKMQKHLRPEIMDFYLHLLSYDSILNILNESVFTRQKLKESFN